MSLKIAVTGEIRSGKDTFAKAVMREVPGIQHLYFAEGIERVIKLLFPEVWYGREKPRKHYQHIGQEMRKLNPEVWINLLAHEYQTRNTKGNFIVTDLRQENEVKWLRENGFVIVKVVADESIRIERMKAAGDVFTPESLNHETEISIRNIKADYVLTNNGTIEEFEKASLALIKKLREEVRCS